MTCYSFRLCLKFPPTSFIAEESQSLVIEIPIDNTQIVLHPRPPSSLQEATTFNVMANNFLSQEAAVACGRHIRETMTACCAILNIGVEISKYEEFYHEDDTVNRTAEGLKWIHLKEANGLIVHPQDTYVHFVGAAISMKSGLSAEIFQQMFIKMYNLCGQLNSKVSLAIELYNSHLFEVSTRARFLHLVSVVETLSKPGRQHAALIEHLNELVKHAKEHLITLDSVSQDDRDNFIQRLNELKRESISSACRMLVCKYLGVEAANVFKECYNIRSKLVHEGAASPKIDLFDHYFKLSRITRKLLYAILCNGYSL